jgi:hypothetical protein
LSKETAKGLAMYDGAAAARSSHDKASQDTAKVSIAAARARCRRLEKPEVLTWSLWIAFESDKNEEQAPTSGYIVMAVTYIQGQLAA